MRRRLLAPLALVAALSAPAAASATTCTPVRVGQHVMAQPEAWRHAVEALIRSTAEEGLPWACQGGEVDLVVGPEGGTLTVIDAKGHAVAREVQTPDDVQPLGEALLAKPLPPPPDVAPPPADETKPPPPARVAAPDPRVLVSAVLGPRYAGGAKMLWGGAALGAAIPFGPWGAGIWLRYDGPIASFAGPQPLLHEVSLGADVFRGFALGPLDLRAALRPSASVVMRGHERSTDSDTHFTPRIGAEALAVIPIKGIFRALVGLDAELSPLDIAEHPGPAGDHSPRYPSFTLGLSAGLEVAVR